MDLSAYYFPLDSIHGAWVYEYEVESDWMAIEKDFELYISRDDENSFTFQYIYFDDSAVLVSESKVQWKTRGLVHKRVKELTINGELKDIHDPKTDTLMSRYAAIGDTIYKIEEGSSGSYQFFQVFERLDTILWKDKFVPCVVVSTSGSLTDDLTYFGKGVGIVKIERTGCYGVSETRLSLIRKTNDL